ncbi:MAG: GntP family permease [Fusobacteriaceae bacterium]
MMEITALGALVGLGIAIFLIIKKVQPVYSLLIGATLGGLVGGANLTSTVGFMIGGIKDIMPSVVRIITAGILAGVLIKSGAANKIAETIIDKLGSKRAILALALSTMLLTSVGVFIDVAVITVSSIALVIGKKANISRGAVLLAMVGGGKAGNIISPNPNTIAAAGIFKVELSSLMLANLVPAVFGLIATVILATYISKKGEMINFAEEENNIKGPSFFSAILGPIVTIFLLSLRPLVGISVDPLIALPLGGVVGVIAMGKVKELNSYMNYGLNKMTGVAVLLIGTGAVAGIIKASSLKDVTVSLLEKSGLPAYLLAPISGIVMSAATASTTAGTSVASETFAPTLLALGIKALYGAAMVHAGATVLDHLPHGSFFHSTAGATEMKVGDRLKLIPYETAIGAVLALVSTIIYGVIL